MENVATSSGIMPVPSIPAPPSDSDAASADSFPLIDIEEVYISLSSIRYSLNVNVV